MKSPTVATIEAVRQAVADARKRGLTISLVPTMGALHAGHISLMEAARQESGFVVATIFVNPTQFGPNEDLARYPRQLDRDLEMCAAAGVDLVFAPDVPTIYPPGFCTYVEVHGLQDLWEGASRPGHFRGYFGQKDAQQARIIQQMVRDLDVPITIRICPIVREPDGLALSSRNVYLDPEQRKSAVVLSQALHEAKARIETGERNAAAIQMELAARIETTPGANLDYAAVVDAVTLRPLDRLTGEVLLLLAVRFGTTRLIDNMPVRVSS
jgi:pantoate--beta-alanine ligase